MFDFDFLANQSMTSSISFKPPNVFVMDFVNKFSTFSASRFCEFVYKFKTCFFSSQMLSSKACGVKPEQSAWVPATLQVKEPAQLLQYKPFSSYKFDITLFDFCDFLTIK